MSQNPKRVEEYQFEMEKDDDDSFHSLLQSEGNTEEELENLTSLDSDTVTDNDENGKGANAGIPTKNIQVPSMAVAQALQSANPKPKRKVSTKSMPSRHLLADPYLVPELRCDSPMPSLEAFDMFVVKKANEAMKKKIEQKDKEVLQKFAYTEIWVADQQLTPSGNRSLSRRFSVALDDYFVNNNATELTLEEQQKGAVNKRLFVDPVNSSVAQSATYQTLSEAKTYVSPFENMPPVPEEKKLPGQKSVVTVPAGFDLTNLVQYNNPNHWHRRSTTLYDSHP